MDLNDASSQGLAQLLALTFGDPLVLPFVLLCLATGMLLIFHSRRHPVPWDRQARDFAENAAPPDAVIRLITLPLLLTLTAHALMQKALERELLTLHQTGLLAPWLQGLFFHLPVVLLIFKEHRHILPRSLAPVRSVVTETARSLRYGLVFYLAAMPWVLLANVLGTYALTRAGLESTPQYAVELVQAVQTPAAWFSILWIACISAPVAEELLFRGVLFPLCLRHSSIVRSILLMAMLFGAMHMNLFALAPLCVMAVFMAIAYLATGRIGVPVVMHILFNTIAIIMILLEQAAGQV